MTDNYSSVRIYSQHLSLDDLVLESGFITDEMLEAVLGDSPYDADERFLWLQGEHGSWVQEKMGPFLEDLMARRTTIERIEWRQEGHDANYDEVVAAKILRRGQPWREFNSELVPNDLSAQITTIREQRNRGENAAAWLTVMALLADIETGAAL